MTTWNPSDKGSNIALSGGNLAMTASGSGGPTTQWCRTTTSKSSGKSVIRITGDLLDGTNSYNQVGLSTASSTTYDGTDTTSILLYRQGSDEWDLRYNGARIAFEYPTSSFPTMPDGVGDVLDIYLDLDNDLIYFKLNGNFFLNSVNYPSPADPTVPTGGVPIDHKTWFIHNSIYVPGYGGVTLDPAPTGLPSGWSAWDSAPAGITGTLGATEAPDTALITGTVATAGISGTLGAQEAPDTALITATTRWNATLGAIEAPDTALVTATTRWNAALAATEAPDTALINGATRWNAALAATEAPDTALITATTRWNAALAATEAPDTALINAATRWNAALAATEASDTALIQGTITTAGEISGSLVGLEAPDTALITGAVTGVAGTLVASEAPDTALINGAVRWNAALAASEAPDTALINGAVRWNALLAAVEASDIVLINGTVTAPATITGTLNAQEAPDVALITGTLGLLQVTGTLNAQEAPDTALIVGNLVLPQLTGILAATEAPDTARINVFSEPKGLPGVLVFGRTVVINRW
jgi:hypothetical protein